MAKKSGNGGFWGVVFLIILGLLASIPSEVWIGIIGFGLLALACYALIASSKTKKTPTSTPVRSASPTAKFAKPATFNAQRNVSQLSDDDFLVDVELKSEHPRTEFKIPKSDKHSTKATWIRQGETATVAGHIIDGGFLYIGSTLNAKDGRTDPSLINPSKPIASNGDFGESQMGYWPSYSEISATSRRAYINWLMDGRKNPRADIGYVFLYFYGLERRVIVDAPDDPAASAELPAIAAEVTRLLEIYAPRSHSFKRYAGGLLDWILLSQPKGKLYSEAIPEFPQTQEIPIYIRVALGQAAIDGAPVPAELALAWTKHHPDIPLRTPAKRCATQFDSLFLQKYTELHGAGITLPRNRTKLKFTYHPASSAFRFDGELKMTFGSTPDVTVLTAPSRNLKEIVELATADLEVYSRYIGKNPALSTSLEGYLLLPATLWPDQAKAEISKLVDKMQDGLLPLNYQELLNSLGGGAMSKERAFALSRALESMNIGFEPDVLHGAKLPKQEDTVVLFQMQPGESTSRMSAGYHASALTLQLASAVATVDGDFTTKEVQHLKSKIVGWSHLTPNESRRLLAHLRLLMSSPVTLPSLKKKLDLLDERARNAIAEFMATLTQSDGEVSPAEVRMLEKVYKMLGLDAKEVFSHLHASATGTNVGSNPIQQDVPENGFKLDPARIAALQRDTEKVSAMLNDIFTEEAPEPVSSTVVQDEPEIAEAGIMGLDEIHAAFARLLIAREEWTREELLDVASDLNLMLDGAIERVNDAAFDTYDAPLLEGDDPVLVNSEIVEKVES